MKEATLESQKSLSFDINFGEQLGEGEVKCEEGGETHRGKMWLGWMLFKLKSEFTFISNYCGKIKTSFFSAVLMLGQATVNLIVVIFY